MNQVYPQKLVLKTSGLEREDIDIGWGWAGLRVCPSDLFTMELVK